VQSQRDGTTGEYRGYFQLVASLGKTHIKFQPDRSISLCLVFESRKSSDFQKMDEKEFGRKIDGVKGIPH